MSTTLRPDILLQALLGSLSSAVTGIRLVHRRMSCSTPDLLSLISSSPREDDVFATVQKLGAVAAVCVQRLSRPFAIDPPA